jgi:propanol-preferring alcohol dehydrogenase
MKAMLLRKVCRLEENNLPLTLEDLPAPVAKEKELLIKVSTCGVCHTELDEIEGRTPPAHLPVILGHQVIGKIIAKGSQANIFQLEDRVGVAWIYSTCGKCQFCRAGNENLCADFKATGRDANGGYAELMTVEESFAYKIPEIFSDAEAAPLLCAGAIGYRSLRLANVQNGQNLGLTGFGGSAHLVLKMAKHKLPASKVFVFARNAEERQFAKELGAFWAGDTMDTAPEKLSAIIDTTPVWRPVMEALKNLAPGGRLVINAIRKEDADKDVLLSLDYPTHLWMEKEIKSVANVSRTDVSEFLQLAADMHIRPEIEEYELADANRALFELKTKKIRGAKVLRIA